MSIDLVSLQGLSALIMTLITGVGGTWLAFRKFATDRKRNVVDIESALRTELRGENETLKKDVAVLKEQIQKLFQENLDLRHENNNNRMRIREFESKLAKISPKTATSKPDKVKKKSKAKKNER